MPLRISSFSRFTLLAFASAFAVPYGARDANAADLLIFAAASTADALEAALGRFSETTGIVVRASYASSGALARQIDLGAPADLYLSANTRWTRWLDERRRLTLGTRKAILGNRLVLIKSALDERRPSLTKPVYRDIAGTILHDRHQRIAIADPDHVPAGTYAKDALTSLGLWDRVSSRLVRARDVRAALMLVERGEAPLGIVYKTDVRPDGKAFILNVFPENTHLPIRYELAIVRGRDTPSTRRLYDFLQSQRAKDAFARFGFITGLNRIRARMKNELPDSR